MKLTLSLVLFVLLSSCGHLGHKKQVTVGESLSAKQYKNLYFTGQPSDADFKKLKEQGFTHIINLRRETEYDERAEEKLVKKLGMNYTHHEFPLALKITDQYVDKVTKSVLKHRSKGKTLVHCSSGNRVAIWLGAHFNKDHNQTKQEAYKTAEDLGLEKEGAKKALRNYLGLEN